MGVLERLSNWWFSSYFPDPPRIKACTFKGLGDKRQSYLDLLAEKMANAGFQQVEMIKIEGLEIMRAPQINQINQSDLIFKSSSRKLCIGVKALSKDGDLRVGFAELYSTMATFWALVAISLFLGLLATYFSVLIIGHGSTDLSGYPRFVGIILVGIFCTVLGGVPLSILGIPILIWKQRIRIMLIEIARSLGSKQIISFEEATVNLEKRWASRSELFAKAFIVIGVIIIMVLIILSHNLMI